MLWQQCRMTNVSTENCVRQRFVFIVQQDMALLLWQPASLQTVLLLAIYSM